MNIRDVAQFSNDGRFLGIIATDAALSEALCDDGKPGEVECGPKPDFDSATEQLAFGRDGWEVIAVVADPQQARSQMAADFAALPLGVRQVFAPIYVTAERFLDLGQWDVARAIVEALDVPAELEPVKAAFLAKLET